MQQFSKPEVGSKITVTIRNKSINIVNQKEFDEISLTGIVGRNDTWNQPNTFVLNISGGHEFVPKRVICLSNVVNIKYENGQIGKSIPSKSQIDEKVFKVKGSKGSEYIVIKRGNKYTCDCIAGGFGRVCKHVKFVIETE